MHILPFVEGSLQWASTQKSTNKTEFSFVDHAIDNLLNRMVLSGCAMLLRLLFVLCINMKTV